MGALHSDVKHLSRPDIAGTAYAAYECAAYRTQTTIGTVRAAQTEFNDDAIARSTLNACCLGGDEGLKIDNIEQGCFHQLCFSQIAFHGEQGFMVKNQRSFLRRNHSAVETKAAQVFEKLSRERVQRTEIGDVLIAET